MAGSSVEMSSEDVILQVIGQQMALYPPRGGGTTGNQTEVRVVQIPTTMKPEVSNRSCVTSWPGISDRVGVATDPQKLFDIRTSAFSAISGIAIDGSISSTTIGDIKKTTDFGMETLEMGESAAIESRRLVTVVLSDKLPEVRSSSEEDETQTRLALRRLDLSGGGGCGDETTNSFNQKLLCCPFIVCEEIVDDRNSQDEDEDEDMAAQMGKYRFQDVSSGGSGVMMTLPVPSPFDLVVDERRRPPLFLFTSN